MSIMDLDKINFDLIVELLEWIVDGEHQVGTELLWMTSFSWGTYQFLWFSWRVQSTNSSTHELAIFCMNYDGKYYVHKFLTP